MKDSLAEDYAQLTAMAQLYIMQECNALNWVAGSPENWLYFRTESAKVPAKRPNVQPFQPPAAPAMPLPNQPSLARSNPPAVASAPPISSPTPAQEKKNTEKGPIDPAAPFLKLDPLPTPEGDPLDDIKTIYKTQFPTHALIDNPPSDSIAKNLQQEWKKNAACPDIALLSFGEPQDRLLFLRNIAKALDIRYGSANIVDARLIEDANKWDEFLKTDNLKLIIACDYAIYGLKKLMVHYKEAAGALRYLDTVPLLLISDLSLYMQEPKLKPSLWKALCEAVKIKDEPTI